MNSKPLDGWIQWSQYVLKALEQNQVDHKEMLEMLRRLDREVTVLKVKAGLWGLGAGALSGVLMLLLKLVT